MDFLEEQEKNKEQIAEEKKSRERADAILQSNIKGVMSMASGRSVVMSFLEICSVFQDPFDENALVMARRVGAQNPGRWLILQLEKACPELYNEMFLEHRINNGETQ